jgi:hypothetical protein
VVFDGSMDYVIRMNRVDRPLALALGSFLLSTAVRADVTEALDQRYQVIIDRNAFGLKPPPPIGTIQTNQPPPPVNIKLTGITRDFAGVKAWMVIPAQPGPGKTSNPQYLTIPEHEKQGDIEVLEINEKEGTVKILNTGTPVELNFKENGMPTPAAMPVPGIPINPRGVPGALPAPGIVPAHGTPPPAIKTAAAPANMSPDMAARYGLQSATPSSDSAIHTIPARNVRTAPIETQTQAAETPVDPVVQRVLMEAQKKQAEHQGIAFPPLPPLPGNPGH